MYVNYILMHFFHFMEKGPYFHKLGPLIFPKVFVTLGKIKVTWQKIRYYLKKCVL